MKKKFISFLIIFGVILSIAVYFVYENENIVSSLFPQFGADNYSLGEVMLIVCFSFPFSVIGKLLTALSDLGTVGNGLAFAILAFFSLIPLIPVLKTYKMREKRLRNFILVLMCPLTAFVLYAFCDISFLSAVPNLISSDLYENVKAVFGASVWSGAVSVFLIEIVGKIKNTRGTDVLKLAKTASMFLCVFLVAGIAVIEFGKLFSKIDMGIGIAEGYISVLCLVKNSLHYILDIAVIFSGISLIDSILDNKTSEEISYYAHRLSKRCTTTLLITVAVSFLYNFIQIMLSPVVFSDISVKIDIPVFSICFVLMILLISKLVTENKKLKEDNDLFI